MGMMDNLMREIKGFGSELGKQILACCEKDKQAGMSKTEPLETPPSQIFTNRVSEKAH